MKAACQGSPPDATRAFTKSSWGPLLRMPGWTKGAPHTLGVGRAAGPPQTWPGPQSPPGSTVALAGDTRMVDGVWFTVIETVDVAVAALASLIATARS